MKKRSLLKLLSGLVLVSGCSETEMPNDIRIFNNTDSTVKFQLEVLREGESIFTSSDSIEPDDDTSYKNVVTNAGEYLITIETDNNLRAKFEWEVLSERDKDDTTSVNFSIKEGGIEAYQTAG